MALLTLEGIYEDGKIEMQEKPAGVKRSRVVITFLPSETTDTELREILRQRFLSRLQKGVDFGMEPLPTREELYADRLRRF